MNLRYNVPKDGLTGKLAH